MPRELYLKNCPTVSSNPKSTTCLLGRGESVEVPVSVTDVGTVLDWKFQTSSGQDIDFKIAYMAHDSCSKKDVLKMKRIRCDSIPESGQMECHEAGTCMLLSLISDDPFSVTFCHFLGELLRPDRYFYLCTLIVSSSCLLLATALRDKLHTESGN